MEIIRYVSSRDLKDYYDDYDDYYLTESNLVELIENSYDEKYGWKKIPIKIIIPDKEVK